MNINLLIDSIVRQTTILIAQLATSAGMRAPLAHTANQVFVDLARELKRQGLGNKVIADMFGLALRTYHDRIARLSESHTVRGQSLWTAVLEHIQEKKVVGRAALLERFRHDDDASVRGVLRDLVESGLVFQSGRGDTLTYRAVSPEDCEAIAGEPREDGIQSLVWVAVRRYAPATAEQIAAAMAMGQETAQAALEKLVADGRISAVERDGVRKYECGGCVIPLGSPVGWEAAVFDHYQAMVTALCTKVRMGRTIAAIDDSVGGSTYGFEVWPGHPLRTEAFGFLASVRQLGSSLRARIETHNREHPAHENAERVIAYVGQSVLSDHDPTTEEEGANR